MNAAVASRPVADLLLATGRPTVQDVTIVFTACCSAEFSHVLDSSPPGEPAFDLTAWWDANGDQATRCKCGLPLPDARGWTP